MNDIVKNLDFDPSIKAFQQYIQDWQGKESFPAYQADEAFRRLRQLKLIYSKILALEEKYLTSAINRFGKLSSFLQGQRQPQLHHNALDEHKMMAKMMADESDELQMYTETFYFFAWRARNSIITLPNLKNFDPTGINRVRNNLIEHPEQIGVYQQAFGFGGPNGPILKNARHKGFEHLYQDKGLYLNAAEFLEKLEKRIALSVDQEN